MTSNLSKINGKGETTDLPNKIISGENSAPNIESDRRNEMMPKQSQLLLTTFDSMNEGAQILDSDFTYLYVNEAAARQGKRSKEELIGNRITDLYPGIEDTELFRVMKSCIEDKKPYNFENRFVYPDDSATWFELNFSPVESGIFILSIDITKRKHAEENLINYRLFSENAREIIFFIDSEAGHIIQSNVAARLTYGYSEEEFLNKTILDLRLDKTMGPNLQEMHIHDETDIIYESIHVKKNGDQFPVEISSRNNRVGDKTVIVHIIRDITERKHYEEQIVHLNRLYAVLSDINQTIVRVTDKSVLFERACQISVKKGLFDMAIIGGFTDDLGLSAIEASSGADVLILEGMADSIDLFKAKDKIRFQRFLDGNPIVYNNVQKEFPDSPRKELLRDRGIKSAAIMPLRVFYKPVGFFIIYSTIKSFFRDAELALLRELAMDISFALEYMEREKRRAEVEDALRRSEQKFRSYIEYSPTGIFLTDNLGNITDANRAGSKMTGYTADELKRLNVRDFFHSDDTVKGIRMFKSLVETGAVSGELKSVNKDGSTSYVLIDSVRIGDDSLIGFIKDITEIKKSQIELEQAKQKAEEMSKLKSSFLANMSHELRTPMNGILGFSKLIANSTSLEAINEMADLLNRSSRRLMDTLNLILDLSRIEAGESRLVPTNLDIVSVINDIVELFKPMAEMKNITLDLETNLASFIVFADPNAIESILNNLVNNAIKFTTAGGVKIVLEADKIDNQLWTVLKIIDTGIGIDKNHFNIIFEEFRQASEGLERSFEGSGLGLTLVKKYVEMLGGKISLESELNKGTAVTVKIPVDNGSVGNVVNEILTKLDDVFGIVEHTDSKKWILVVEDDPLNLRLVRTFLKDKYFSEYATNSDEALMKASLRHFDAFLMDINLGKSKNGIYTTQKLKEMSEYKDTPIIAMTAYAMKGDREEFLASGCSHYISKPFEDMDLYELLDRVFGG